MGSLIRFEDPIWTMIIHRVRSQDSILQEWLYNTLTYPKLLYSTRRDAPSTPSQNGSSFSATAAPSSIRQLNSGLAIRLSNNVAPLVACPSRRIGRSKAVKEHYSVVPWTCVPQFYIGALTWEAIQKRITRARILEWKFIHVGESEQAQKTTLLILMVAPEERMTALKAREIAKECCMLLRSERVRENALDNGVAIHDAEVEVRECEVNG